MQRVIVFDLDFTIWDGKKIYPNIIPLLESLKTSASLYVASFNLVAPDVCRKLNIHDYFTDILYDRSLTKKQMMIEIMNRLG